jgi:hypothetical protein
VELVPRREDLHVPLGQRVPDYGLALVRAEHDPDRRILVGGRQLALVVVDVLCRLPDYSDRDPGDEILWAVSWAYGFTLREEDTA